MTDVYSAFQGCDWLRRHGVASLQVHPTSAGYRVIAQALKAVIRPSGAAAPWLQWWCSGVCVKATRPPTAARRARPPGALHGAGERQHWNPVLKALHDRLEAAGKLPKVMTMAVMLESTIFNPMVRNSINAC